MELVNKVILDSMVRLVREVPWGPSREQLLSMSAEFESDGRFERGWGMIEGDLQCVSKVEAGDIADLWATEFKSHTDDGLDRDEIITLEEFAKRRDCGAAVPTP